jgi:peptidoglycan/LPS O-acetylase OafA/YrhL
MKRYFPALDSLRFFASLNIVLLHFSSSSLLSYTEGAAFDSLIKFPFFNTSVFFLLSGFIYSILFSKQVPKLKDFMKERFWRLYPLHIFCTLMVFAIILYRTNIFNDSAYAIKSLALNISLLWAFVPKLGHSLNQPSWALSIFFLCYALTPVFSRFLNKRSKKELWLLFLALWAISISIVACFNNIANLKELPSVFRSTNFFSGIMLGRLFLSNAIPLPKKALLNDLFLLLVFIALYINVCHFKRINYGYAYYIVSPVLYSAFLLFLANNRGIIVWLFSRAWLRNVGKASFYIYLLHSVVIQFLHLYLDRIHWKNIFDKPMATAIIIILLYGGCTVFYIIKNK